MKPRTLVLAVLAALAGPHAALAADDDLRELTEIRSVVEVGAAYLDEDARKFGEYTGLKDRGGYFLGDIDYLRRNVDSAWYSILRGTNLGLDSRNLYLEHGRQGRFAVFGEYDQLPKYGPTARTFFDGAGTGRLTLPAGFQGLTTTDTANTPAGFNLRSGKINPFLHDVDLETERKTLRFGVGGQLARDWAAKVTFSREDKEGTKLFGAVIGNSGGNPRAVLAPEPVDYATTQVEALVSFTTPALQLQGSYYLSKFDNAQKTLAWQNPYAAINGWNAPAGFPTGFGPAALAPDNDYQRLGLQGGYNFSAHTRLSFNLERSRAEQDDAFLPYTVNPALTVTTPLPRGSADARIDTTVATFNLTAQPARHLHLRAQYRYEDMDNATPQAQYVYIGGDSTNQATNPNSDRYRVNLPISTTKHVAKLGGTWEFMPRTKLKFAYDFDQEERTNTEVDESRQHTVILGVRRSLTDGMNGELTYSRAKRTGSEYCYNCTYLASFSPQFTGPQAATNTNWDNLPLMRRFGYADRDREKWRLQLMAMPGEQVGLQIFGDYMQDEYPDSPMGLQRARTLSATVELTFTPTDRVSGSAYYTHDRAKYNEDGRTFNAAQKPTFGFAAETPNDWFNSGEDRGRTIGASARMVIAPKRSEIGVDAFYSRTKGVINTIANAGVTARPTPLPDLATELQSLQLWATYALRKDTTLKLQYWYQKLKTDDWQWEGYVPATLANVVTAGVSSPDYRVNFFGVSVLYRF